MEYYFYIKALHIVSVVSWFAGLFYIVRLFIYHTEANDKPEAERTILQNQFIIMERKLWNIITTPAMGLTFITGITMLVLNPDLLKDGWMHIKLTFIVLLKVYHIMSGRIRKNLSKGEFKRSSSWLRMWNEVATVFLVCIVFLAVLKNSVNWLYGAGGFFAFAILLMVMVKVSKKRRTR